jgi:hypothetical protein
LKAGLLGPAFDRFADQSRSAEGQGEEEAMAR